MTRDPLQQYVLGLTRRQFFGRSAASLSTFLGASALG
jgi:hypothetical protein